MCEILRVALWIIGWKNKRPRNPGWKRGFFLVRLVCHFIEDSCSLFVGGIIDPLDTSLFCWRNLMEKSLSHFGRGLFTAVERNHDTTTRLIFILVFRCHGNLQMWCRLFEI